MCSYLLFMEKEMSLSEKKRIVVKVGTSTLTHRSTGKTNLSRMAKLVSVLADLKNAGHEVVLVSSGAVGIGLAKMMIKNRPDEIRTLQAAAAVGQCELMFLYDKFFSEYSQVVAQLLCTMEDIENPQSRLHLTDSIEELLQKDIVPIINENDSVSVHELLRGDNDCLSALLAVTVKADILLLLTDTDGLYDSDPTLNPDARLIAEVDRIDDAVEKLAGDSHGTSGTGGFVTKIKAAKIATNRGIPVVVFNGANPTKIYKVLAGESVGTYFKAGDEHDRFRIETL